MRTREQTGWLLTVFARPGEIRADERNDSLIISVVMVIAMLSVDLSTGDGVSTMIQFNESLNRLARH